MHKLGIWKGSVEFWALKWGFLHHKLGANSSNHGLDSYTTHSWNHDQVQEVRWEIKPERGRRKKSPECWKQNFAGSCCQTGHWLVWLGGLFYCKTIDQPWTFSLATELLLLHCEMVKWLTDWLLARQPSLLIQILICAQRCLLGTGRERVPGPPPVLPTLWCQKMCLQKRERLQRAW